MNLEGTTAEDARRLTRRRREKRTDHVLEANMHERCDLECPECRHEWTAGYYGPVASLSPSFGSCPNWDCDAYLKVVHDGTEAEPEAQPAAHQPTLEQFANSGRGGGEA